MNGKNVHLNLYQTGPHSKLTPLKIFLYLSYILGNANYNKCNTEKAIKITKPSFKKFRDDQAEAQKSFRGCSISADEKFIFCYNNYMKQWRHSFYADYYIFDVEKGMGSTISRNHYVLVTSLLRTKYHSR